MINNVIHIIRFTPKKWIRSIIRVLATEDNKGLLTEDGKKIKL